MIRAMATRKTVSYKPKPLLSDKTKGDLIITGVALVLIGLFWLAVFLF